MRKSFSARYGEEQSNVPLEYGLCKVWFFSFAPLSILSVAHYEHNTWKIQFRNQLSILDALIKLDTPERPVKTHISALELIQSNIFEKWDGRGVYDL